MCSSVSKLDKAGPAEATSSHVQRSRMPRSHLRMVVRAGGRGWSTGPSGGWEGHLSPQPVTPRIEVLDAGKC